MSKKGQDKIKNIFMSMRCIKGEISLDHHKFPVYQIKDSLAKVVGSKIIITSNFLNIHSAEEQIAILYHETYHLKFFTKVKRFFNSLRFFSFQRARWEEEFEADKYSAKMFDKFATLSFLKKAKSEYLISVKYNPKTHPPIDERIKRIEQLKF